MTLLSELIEIPEEVHKSDFVISLATAIGEPEKTIRDYVVTPQLAQCFDEALSLVTSSVADGKSKATYLHASFGAGKTAMMAVLHLLLNGETAARSVPKLAPVIAKYADRLDGKRFLLVPYHFIGKTSMEQVVLGSYVEYLRKIHPEAPAPAVFLADGILADARLKRPELGEETFFRLLSEGEEADEWGAYAGVWDAARFEAALEAPPGSGERDQLVSALVGSHYRALPGHAQATAEGYVPLDMGLDAISRHAKGLGYDAVVLFLDELVLWLESRMSEASFVSREGNKIVKLVEADAAERPAPIISFIARQRGLRELVGDHVLGAEAASAMEVLRHSEGRFGTIVLEDGNLPAIAEERLLSPRSEGARQVLDDAFEKVRSELEQRNERDILLSHDADLAEFRRLYPFSPALVDALVGLSGAMQRERTALKVMLQLLVNGRESLRVGQLIPLGDLWDAIDAGDEPLTEVMRAQFAQARRLWRQRLQPLLLSEHGVTEEESGSLLSEHLYVTDARLLKSLLIAALVPGVAPLRGLTVGRLTALNSGIVRAFVPGTERQQVLNKLRRWASQVGEIRLGEDEQDPSIAVELSGIDTSAILDQAREVDSSGARRRLIKDLLWKVLEVKDLESMYPWAQVTWRGTKRRVDLVFGNVRDTVDLPDEMLRAGNDPKIVIDYPWDEGDRGPADDRARVDQLRTTRSPEWTAVWIPNFLTQETRRALGTLVQLDYIFSADTFDSMASHLAPSERPSARSQLENQRSALRERISAAVRQAYGVDPVQPGVVEEGLALGEQIVSLDPRLTLRPPPGTSLRSHLDGLADQMFSFRYPKHPEFTDPITRAELVHTLNQVTVALQNPNGRFENVEPAMRRVLTKIAGPLKLGTMYQAHFIADLGEWKDLIERRRAEAGATTLTVDQVRRWLDWADTPAERRGLTTEVADLVVLLFAAATNRVIVAAGQPVAGAEIGKVRPDWELRPQNLPSQAMWKAAVSRAADMGVVPISTMLSANTVADLGQKIQQALASPNLGDCARTLVNQLEAANARLGIPGGDRLATAKAARSLVNELRRRPDAAVEILAECQVPTTVAALGTSAKQAADVAVELERTNWDLLLTGFGLGEPWTTESMAMKDRLAEALVKDELVMGLVPKLRSAIKAATELLARASRVPQPTPLQPGKPTGEGPDVTYTQEEAEKELMAVEERLRRIRLELHWRISDLEDHGAG